MLSCENLLVVMVRQVGSAPQLRPCLYSLPPVCQDYLISRSQQSGGTVRECALLKAARDAPRYRHQIWRPPGRRWLASSIS